jgi:hypothetical protein
MIRRAQLVLSLLIAGGMLALGSVLSPSLSAQTPPPAPPPKVCGDGIVQRPNDNGDTEWCDQHAYCAGNPAQQCATNGDCGSGGQCIFPCAAHAPSGTASNCGAKLMGWAWASTFGWLSLNRDNCYFLDNGVLPEACAPFNLVNEYSVDIAPDGALSGWDWSDTIGWVCVGSACNSVSSAEFGTAAPAGGWNATVIDEGAPNNIVTGWAKGVVSGMGDQAWFSLSCRNTDSSCAVNNSSDYGVRVNQRQFHPTGQSSINVTRYTLGGFAWNGNDNPPNSGLGWLQFDPSITGVTPFLQTKYGDVYSRGGVSGNQTGASISGCNATYRILSGGEITNVCSEQELEPGGDVYRTPFFGQIDFPSAKTNYANALGKLDLAGLQCASGNPPCVNRYGTTVEAFALPTGGALPALGNKVYVAPGNLTISSPFSLTNGAGFASGAGTIIVRGDLVIDANITYPTQQSLSRFRNLASVAWIVLGDVRISGAVEQVAGNIIVLGDPARCQASTGIGCGLVTTCASGDCNHQLTISGVLMAHQFAFGRTYASPAAIANAGSEVIVYDGRLLANTPPGLTDVISALPTWKAGVFSAP